jgi:hypothetical protein
MSNVRPIRLLTASELAAVRATVEATLGQWTAQWCSAGTAVTVECAAATPPSAEQLAAATWLCGKSADTDVWFCPEAESLIGAALFGAGSGAPLGAAVARLAINDLLARWVGDDGAQVAEAPTPQHLWQTGRRVVAVAVTFGGKAKVAALTLLIESRAQSAVTTRADPGRGVPHTVRSAVRDQRVQIEVSLGQVEIELGLLRSLAIGDVLRLDRALDAAADIRICGSRVDCVGYLGAHDGQRAVALARA